MPGKLPGKRTINSKKIFFKFIFRVYDISASTDEKKPLFKIVEEWLVYDEILSFILMPCLRCQEHLPLYVCKVP
jgi:hypothetical protein